MSCWAGWIGRLSWRSFRSLPDRPVPAPDVEPEQSGHHRRLQRHTHMAAPDTAITSMAEKRIFVIAGPNGAGKTTFATEFLPNEARCPVFVNADLIAAGLSPSARSKSPSPLPESCFAGSMSMPPAARASRSRQRSAGAGTPARSRGGSAAATASRSSSCDCPLPRPPSPASGSGCWKAGTTYRMPSSAAASMPAGAIGNASTGTSLRGSGGHLAPVERNPSAAGTPVADSLGRLHSCR